MNQRIQQALDGDIEPLVLNSEERWELRQMALEIDAVVKAVPTQALPELAPGILARIRETRQNDGAVAPRDRLKRPSLASWLWTPRNVSFGWRPAYSLAAAALVAVLVGVQALNRATDKPSQVFTRFVVRIPGANNVSLAGDFTGWQPSHSMTRSGTELWTVVVPLEPGVHTYSFVVDGERWIADPAAPSVDDGFGGANSRVAVLTPDGRKL